MKAYFPFLNVFLEVEWEGGIILQSRFLPMPLQSNTESDSLFDKTGGIIKKIIKKYELTGRIDLKGLKLSFEGVPPFHLKVYNELLKVPPGMTVTYKELAERCGNKNAARAVGNALARNKLVLFVPCHRVVSVKRIGGWSSLPGLKEKLLELERKASNL